MRNNIFILTDDLNFFYLVNKELNRLKIKFKILNVGNKIPRIPNSLILTTQEEVTKFEARYKSNVNILPYSDDEIFSHYIIRVLAASRVSPIMLQYSELTFSIDPGSKHLGLAVFLDGFYLNSHTLYSDDDLLTKIEIYINIFQNVTQKPLSLIFKFGSGILSLNFWVLEKIYQKFKKKNPSNFF